MNYVEMTTEEAINMLKNSKGNKVLVAIQNLETDDDTIFYLRMKSDCEEMINKAKSISSMCDDFVKKLDLFTEKQSDLYNIQPHGFQKTILING